MRFKNWNIVITGASRGIGKELAIEFAKEGANIFAIATNFEKLKELKSDIEKFGTKCEIFVGSVSDEYFINRTANEIISHNKIDVLINNAGIAYLKPLTELTLEQIKETFEVNTLGVLIVTKAFLPSLIQNKSGNIITISSIAGKNGFYGGTAYCASKFALTGFNESLMSEIRKHNIKVALIYPGTVNTELLQDSPFAPEDVNKVLQTQDIVHAVFSVVTLPQNAMISEIVIRPTNPK